MLMQPVREKLIWQQDGAPPHYGLIVRNFVNDMFGQWIGRHGTVEWPPHSPDVTPMDFSVWGIMKDRAYSVKIRDLEHLKEHIEAEFKNLFSQNICDTICASVLQRGDRCIANGGGHFEHLV
jgi:hypothetical protein